MLRSLSLSLAAFAAIALGASHAHALSFTLGIDDSGKGYNVLYTLNGNERIGHIVEFDLTYNDVAGSAYCIDLQQPYVLGENDNYTFLDLSTVKNGNVAAWLLETYRPDRSAPNAQEQITALQLSIWEVITDSNWNFSDGAFQVLQIKGTGLSLAQSYLDSIPPELPPIDASILGFAHTNHQDFIYIPNVPEPATALLFGMGIAALASRRRA